MSRASASAVAVSPHDLTDHELVAETRRGDDRAFEVLFGRYRERITAYVQGMVGDHGRAEDLTQEVFISALRRMRATERPIAFKPWIYEIAKNACIDQYRRSRRGEELSYDAEDDLGAADRGRLVAAGPSPDDAVEARERLRGLRAAFGDLSESHHRILVLRELEGRSYREIGEELGMSRPAVESTLFRARRRLTEEYEELVTGKRCERVQGILSAAEGGGLAGRDRRRMARHLSYCQPCRRHAHACGHEFELGRAGVAGRLAALLPLPAVLRPRRGGEADASGVAHWPAALTPHAEPLGSTLAKAATAAATVLVAAVGSNVMTGSEQGFAFGSGGGSERRAAEAVAGDAAGAGKASFLPVRVGAMSGEHGTVGRAGGVRLVGTSVTGHGQHGVVTFRGGAGAPAGGGAAERPRESGGDRSGDPVEEARRQPRRVLDGVERAPSGDVSVTVPSVQTPAGDTPGAQVTPTVTSPAPSSGAPSAPAVPAAPDAAVDVAPRETDDVAPPVGARVDTGVADVDAAVTSD